ncbi:hypothetical protein GGR50DRAFT_208988 [Xylaria sp. CBS 124048]|nr:hypothetical protein GGR50DRAFT_208988 [Xylaria sp. CBS 124048]
MNNTEDETTSPNYTETLELTSISGTKKRRCPASDTTTVITRASVELATTRPLAICNGNGKEEACLCVALRWPVGEDVDIAVRQASLFAFERTIEAVSSGLVSFESYKPPRMAVIAPSITTPARTSAGTFDTPTRAMAPTMNSVFASPYGSTTGAEDSITAGSAEDPRDRERNQS